MISLALFCSCCGAFLLAVFCTGPWSAVLHLSRSDSHSLGSPLAWAWISGLLGLVPGLITGSAVWHWRRLQCRFGWGRFVCTLTIIYCLFSEKLVLGCGLFMDFVLHCEGVEWGGGGGGQNSPLIQIVMLPIMIRLVAIWFILNLLSSYK